MSVQVAVVLCLAEVERTAAVCPSFQVAFLSSHLVLSMLTSMVS